MTILKEQTTKQHMNNVLVFLLKTYHLSYIRCYRLQLQDKQQIKQSKIFYLIRKPQTNSGYNQAGLNINISSKSNELQHTM